MQENNIKLEGIVRRVLLISYHSNSWLTSTKFYEKICEAFRNGTCDRVFTQNYIFTKLRELSILNLLDKRESFHSHGRTSLYRISDYGIKILRSNNLIPEGVVNELVKQII